MKLGDKFGNFDRLTYVRNRSYYDKHTIKTRYVVLLKKYNMSDYIAYHRERRKYAYSILFNTRQSIVNNTFDQLIIEIPLKITTKHYYFQVNFHRLKKKVIKTTGINICHKIFLLFNNYKQSIYKVTGLYHFKTVLNATQKKMSTNSNKKIRSIVSLKRTLSS